jgi:hypothetical protein
MFEKANFINIEESGFPKISTALAIEFVVIFSADILFYFDNVYCSTG